MQLRQMKRRWSSLPSTCEHPCTEAPSSELRALQDSSKRTNKGTTKKGNSLNAALSAGKLLTARANFKPVQSHDRAAKEQI